MSSSTDVETGKSGLLSGKVKESEKFVPPTTTNESFYDSKFFRLLTVIMYVCLVSGIGFLFALYHLFFWDSTMPPVPIVNGHEAY